MSLQLQRPIAFIDLETTGVNLSTDRIIEIAIVKILTDGSRQVKRKFKIVFYSGRPSPCVLFSLISRNSASILST